MARESLYKGLDVLITPSEIASVGDVLMVSVSVNEGSERLYRFELSRSDLENGVLFTTERNNGGQHSVSAYNSTKFPEPKADNVATREAYVEFAVD